MWVSVVGNIRGQGSSLATCTHKEEWLMWKWRMHTVGGGWMDCEVQLVDEDGAGQLSQMSGV